MLDGPPNRSAGGGDGYQFTDILAGGEHADPLVRGSAIEDMLEIQTHEIRSEDGLSREEVQTKRIEATAFMSGIGDIVEQSPCEGFGFQMDLTPHRDIGHFYGLSSASSVGYL